MMSLLSQLAAEVAAGTMTMERYFAAEAASAAPPADDSSQSALPADGEDACLSSTPPPFVAPDMLRMVVQCMPRWEQQQYREQLLQSPGLYARWIMRRDGAQARGDGFSEHLLAGRVTKFEVAFAYIGLRREVICVYTIRGRETVFREIPLRTLHLRFREDGQEVHLMDGAGWRAMHSHFEMKLLPYLLLATAH